MCVLFPLLIRHGTKMRKETGNRRTWDGQMRWSNAVSNGVVERGGPKISSPQLCEDKKVFHISVVRDFPRAHMHHASRITQLSGKHRRNISYYVILHPARLSHCHFRKTPEVTFLILVPDFVLNSGCCMGPKCFYGINDSKQFPIIDV